MIVGFTERSSTVPEVNFDYIIDVCAETGSERFYGFDFVVLNTSGNATVHGVPSKEDADAKFGAPREDGYLVEENVLFPNETKLFKNLRAKIFADNLNENIECFTILISSPPAEGLPDVFHCNQDHEGADNFFCHHTICINDTAGWFS